MTTAVQRGRIPNSQHGMLGAHHSLSAAAAAAALASITGTSPGLAAAQAHAFNPLHLNPQASSYLSAAAAAASNPYTASLLGQLHSARNSQHNSAMMAAESFNSHSYLSNFVSLLLRGESYCASNPLLGALGQFNPNLSAPPPQSLPPTVHAHLARLPVSVSSSGSLLPPSLSCSQNASLSHSLSRSSAFTPTSAAGTFSWSHLASLQPPTATAIGVSSSSSSASVTSSSTLPLHCSSSPLLSSLASLTRSPTSATNPLPVSALTQPMIPLVGSSVLNQVSPSPSSSSSLLGSPQLTADSPALKSSQDSPVRSAASLLNLNSIS
jgi:hypothetical protein